MNRKMGKEIHSRFYVIKKRIMKDLKQYGIGILAVVLLYFGAHALFNAFCPSVIISGFPCPGCGMTRAVLYLFRGQFRKSWNLNPAAVFWVIWVFLFAYERYIKGRRSRALSWAACGIVLFMVAAYIVRMKLYFPDIPPCVYTKNNLFAEVVPGYDKIVKYLTGR